VTQLEEFIRANGIKPARLTKIASVSRQHLLRLRNGRMDPSRRVMVRITRACTVLLNRPVVVGELFDLRPWQL